MYGGNGDTGWTISQSGAATFKTIYASNKGTIGGWTINGNKIQGGNVTLNANGNIDCTGGNGWYIHSDGSARFGNLRIDSAGNITANGGKFNNVNVSGTIDATSGRFDNCTIGGSCTIGGERVDGAFVKNANIASGAVTNGKIATGAITASKIAAGTITADKIAAGTITGDKIDGGTHIYAGMVTASEISGMTVGADFIGLNNEYGNYSIGGNTGKSLTTYVLTNISLSLQGQGQALGGIAVESGTLKVWGRQLKFMGGILVDGGTEVSANVNVGISS